MRLAASVGGGVLVPSAALLLLCGCDVVSGLTEFEVAGAGGGSSVSCEPGSLAPGCPGSLGEALQITSLGDAYVTAVATDQGGRTYLAVFMNAEVSVAGKVISHLEGWDSAIVALEADSTVAWFQGAAGTGDDRITDLALASDGDLLVTGYFTAQVAVAGGEPLQEPDGAGDSFLVKLAANNGALRWSVQYGGLGQQLAQALAVDADGHIYVVGEYQWELTVDDGGAANTNAGDPDAFVDKRGADGQALWHVVLGDADMQRARSVAMSSLGEPVVVGDYRGTISFDADGITAEHGRDLFVLKLQPGGSGPIWARSFAAPGAESLYAVALDGDDRIFLAGTFDSELQLDRPLTTNGTELFAASLSSEGEPRWSLDFPGTLDLPFTQRMLAVGEGSDVFVTGRFRDDAFVGQNLSSVRRADDTPTDDVFTASFDADGNHRWTHPFGGEEDELAGVVTVAAGGQILFGGGFRGELELSAEATFESAGAMDGYLLRLAP